jgi:hypothetical protein
VAQIFVSHSAKDIKQKNFINQAFASTKVEAKYEEIEAIISGKRTAAQIKADIAQSNAIFVVLGPNVETLSHTRDWVTWESGNAAAFNRDVWVLEAFEDFPKLSVVIPHLRHYVCFDYNDPWLAYLRQIVSSYDDSHVLKVGAAGAGIGAMIGGEGGAAAGAVIGGLAGMILSTMTTANTRPPGFSITCLTCQSVYSIHVGAPAFRCPVCNARLQFVQPAMAQGAVAGS